MTRRPQRGDGNTVFGTADVEYGMTASPQVKAPEKVDIYAAAVAFNSEKVVYHPYRSGPDGLCTMGVGYGRRDGIIRCGEPESDLSHGEPPSSESAAALDVHAALNTYEVAADVPAGVTLTTPDTLMVVGANRRRLVARWTPEGVWLGGCLIADEVVALALAAFITREDEGA